MTHSFHRFGALNARRWSSRPKAAGGSELWNRRPPSRASVLCSLAASTLLACRTVNEAWRAPPDSGRPSTSEASLAEAMSALGGRQPADAPRGPNRTLLSLSRGELWATWNELRGDSYELDTVERFLDEGDEVTCDQKSLVRHGGTHVRYLRSVQVNPAFRQRLERFEEVVRDVALEVYGRAPSRLRHFGAYSCRSSRRRAHRLSEHALGNAIDVIGFDFAPAKKSETLAVGLPKRLRAAFEVRVARHWGADASHPTAAVHSRFLRELSERLTERRDVFRVMIGPSRSDHADHFHFDMSPWRYINF